MWRCCMHILFLILLFHLFGIVFWYHYFNDQTGLFEDYGVDEDYVEHSWLEWRKQWWLIWWGYIRCSYFEWLFESQIYRCPFRVSQSLDFCKRFLFSVWFVNDSSFPKKNYLNNSLGRVRGSIVWERRIQDYGLTFCNSRQFPVSRYNL